MCPRPLFPLRFAQIPFMLPILLALAAMLGAVPDAGADARAHATASPTAPGELHPSIAFMSREKTRAALLASPESPESPAVSNLRQPSRYSYRLTDALLISGLSFAGAHAVDNILVRRTFAKGQTAKTLIQAVYVAGGVAFLQDAGPLLWTLYSASLVTAHSFGHLFVPSASDHISTFHDNWTDGENNRLGLQSGAAGRVSQGVLIGLDLSFAAVLISSIRDGYHCGFTLKRRKCWVR